MKSRRVEVRATSILRYWAVGGRAVSVGGGIGAGVGRGLGSLRGSGGGGSRRGVRGLRVPGHQRRRRDGLDHQLADAEAVGREGVPQVRELLEAVGPDRLLDQMMEQL